MQPGAYTISCPPFHYLTYYPESLHPYVLHAVINEKDLSSLGVLKALKPCAVPPNREVAPQAVG